MTSFFMDQANPTCSVRRLGAAHISASWEDAFARGYEQACGIPPVRVGLLGALLWEAGYKGSAAGTVCGEIRAADQDAATCPKCRTAMVAAYLRKFGFLSGPTSA